jgi:hypothetical protein
LFILASPSFSLPESENTAQSQSRWDSDAGQAERVRIEKEKYHDHPALVREQAV